MEAKYADPQSPLPGSPLTPAADSRSRLSRNLLSRIRGSFAGRPVSTPDVPDTARAIKLCHDLVEERDVTGLRTASQVLGLYATFDRGDRAAFFESLVNDFSPRPELVKQAADAYSAEPTQARLIGLQQAVEAPRRELFRRLNMAPGGLAALVRMRADLLSQLDQHPHWCGIDADLSRLFKSWFNRAFLELKQIDWQTSAAILEKLIAYEAVHQIHGWHDLRRRLQADRRCYGFFHHAMPDEPIIFIQVALVRGMSAGVQPLLDPKSPVADAARADCAIFYSITTCHDGLRGVSFGNLLIKQVVLELQRKLPGLKTFATLSPIPGFRRWLREQAASCQSPRLSALLARLEDPEWWIDPERSNALKQELAPLCAHYLLCAKRGKEPVDAVARFHLGNGARLQRLNWLSDTSPAGMSRAAGLTVNYLYDPSEVERNHDAYKRDCTVVASRSFERLAASLRPAGDVEMQVASGAG